MTDAGGKETGFEFEIKSDFKCTARNGAVRYVHKSSYAQITARAGSFLSLSRAARQRTMADKSRRRRGARKDQGLPAPNTGRPRHAQEPRREAAAIDSGRRALYGQGPRRLQTK